MYDIVNTKDIPQIFRVKIKTYSNQPPLGKIVPTSDKLLKFTRKPMIFFLGPQLLLLCGFQLGVLGSYQRNEHSKV